MHSSARLLRESLGRECRVLGRAENRLAVQIEGKYIPALQVEPGDVLVGYAEYIGSLVAILGSKGTRHDQAELYCMLKEEDTHFLCRITSCYEVSCGAVIFRKKEDTREFLIIREKKGHTGFPKGHREKKETQEENALREILEETGLSPRLIPGFSEENHYIVDKKIEKHVIYFLAQELEDAKLKLQPEEVEAAYFLRYEEALQTLTHRQDREILRHAEDFLKENSRF